MSNKDLRKTTLLTSIVWLLLALMALGGAAFAWFTFSVTTNITPIASSIGSGGVDLKISESYNGPFDAQCTLTYQNNENSSLYPVSTSTLDRWYEPVSQDRNGISTRFREITEQNTLDGMTFHGKVYLLAENQDCDIYLNRADMTFDMANATDQAARLGLIFRNDMTGQELSRVILRLDDMSMERSGASAETTQTVSQENAVIDEIDGSGYPAFANDPAEDINEYMAYTETQQGGITVGNKQLTRLPANTVITVEYYLYLEGCDENCVNSIQDGDMMINLGFAGVGYEVD